VKGQKSAKPVLAAGLRKYLRRTVKEYEKQVADTVQGYSEEGKLQDDPTLGRMLKGIEKSLADTPQGGAPRDRQKSK
jgi:hypothetical protein